jgi:hypothetical protein
MSTIANIVVNVLYVLIPIAILLNPQLFISIRIGVDGIEIKFLRLLRIVIPYDDIEDVHVRSMLFVPGSSVLDVFRTVTVGNYITTKKVVVTVLRGRKVRNWAFFVKHPNWFAQQIIEKMQANVSSETTVIKR